MSSLNEILALMRNFNKSDSLPYIIWQKSGADRFVLADDGELQLANATASGQGMLLGGDVELYRSAADVLGMPDILNKLSTDIIGIRDLYGDGTNNHNFYSNAAITDATERSLILNLLNATGDAWLPMITLTPNAATPTITLGYITGIGAAPYATQPVGSLGITGGIMIGANSLNNLIDDASGGAGSTPMYIGNQSILVSNGINFGPGAVTSITVVNGQITAIS